jgi:dipeptidase D
MSNQETYFEPRAVNDIFVDITTKPHCSGDEDAVRNYVICVVKKFNKEHSDKAIEIVHYDENATVPGERIIVLRREGSGAKVGKPTVILQAHMDMVCVKGQDADCDIFPIELNKYQDECGVNWLKGAGSKQEEGTTLGADDGIGVATALAIITNAEGDHGPIECLFTVQEETDMGGARGFDISLLTGEKYINLDSEDYNIITYGSAAGSGVEYRSIPGSDSVPGGNTTVSIDLEKLTGGHSGVNINDGNANAIKVLAEFNNRLSKARKLKFNIVEFKGGSKTNAIPNKASMQITFGSERYAEFEEWCKEIFGAFKQEYSDSDPEFCWCMEKVENPEKMLDIVSSNNLNDMLLSIPHGPLKMMHDPGREDVVETSTNLAIVNADVEQIAIQCSNRSASDDSLDAVEEMHKAVAHLFGIRMFLQLDTANREDVLKCRYKMENSGVLILSGRYPAWVPNDESELLDVAYRVYKKMYPGKAEKNVIHAGLECGWIVKKFKDAGREMDCIAIGPTIKTPHTWQERLETDTVGTFYECVTRIISKIWSES